MRPSFEQFIAALRDPQLRAAIGLVISDADAASLLSRDDWATGYFASWLAMFPAEVDAAPKPAYLSAPPPAVAPTAAPSGPSYAPEPLYAASIRAATPASPPSVPWESLPPKIPWVRRPIPKRARVPVIVIGSAAAAVAVALFLIGSYHQAVEASALGHAATASSSPRSAGPSGAPSASPSAPPATSPSASASATPPEGKYGLSSEEYELMEAVSAPYGETLELQVAQGATEAQIRAKADAFELEVTKACDVNNAQNSWQNATYEKAFSAGYEAQTKATPEQAARVWRALGDYCIDSR